ncbi:MAG: hypothetical protein COV35_04745 [Alphaproteobacteria bacterium CG11_big_fil_rev_8_21_14_0_20_39_49]|nr:MAG: hypothetical protein COV35_04745 [Alphaproteobacteria bacterium CG11_big_fil_rev_8_21_14_0_20_39_49]
MRAAYIYIVILLEGYVVLSTELVAIRQLIPFVGSGTETMAIVIAAVLMPLSFGYYVGGNYRVKYGRKKLITIRNKLIKNVISASVILVFGLSYILLEIYFGIFDNYNISHRVAQATIFSLLFIVYPVYLLGQTAPLVSNYFRGSHLSKATGTILMFSTIGSFLGAILSTLVLMGAIGVHNVIIVNIVLLLIVVVILSKKLFSMNNFLMVVITFIAFGLNGSHIMEGLGVVEDNNYNIVRIENGEEDGTKVLIVNRSPAAKYSANPELRFGYIRYVEERFVNPIANQDGVSDKPKSILVIGAGGFTFGQDDTFNNYTFVDIDSTLKEVSEKYLLKSKLKDNRKFVAMPARGFFNQTDEKYDLIFLDAFTNVISTPFQLITKEFFEQVKEHLNEDGIVLFNVITSPNFNDKFSVKLDRTFRQVFSPANRQVLRLYDGWTGVDSDENVNTNVVYSYHNRNYTKGNYTDNINTYYLDR